MSLPPVTGLTAILTPTGVSASWTATPLADYYEVSLDGSDTLRVTGSSWSFATPAPGAHTVSVTPVASDAAAAFAAFTVPVPGMDLFSFGGLPSVAQAAAIPPGVNGLSYTTTWGALQSSYKGTPNWSNITNAINVAQASGKKLYLRIHFGDGCPSDLPNMVTLPGSCFASGPNQPASVTMPMPNDQVFQHYAGLFIASFGTLFGSSPTIAKVAMCGGSRQGEMVLPTCATWTNLCAKHGLTAATLLASWQFFVTAYRKAFPNHTTTLGVENPMGILQNLLSWIASIYGTDTIEIQQNGLRSTTNATQNLLTSAKALGFETGWQTWGDVVQGTGPLATTLGIAKQSGAKYVEVYAQDVNNAINDPLFAEYGNL